MGKLIKIDKYSHQNGIYYYFVHSNTKKTFFLGIDSINKKILIFETNNFSEPLLVIGEDISDERINLNHLEAKLFWPALSQVRKALMKNIFPDKLDYSA